MSLSYNRSVMLDYARGACGREDYEPEGEYIPEPEEEEDDPQAYGGEFRYVNMGPTKVRRLLKTEKDPVERKAMEVASQFWGPPMTPPEDMGWVHRGEPREAIVATSMSELGRAVQPVQHVFLQGALTVDAPYGGTTSEKNWELGSIIDFDWLMGDLPTEPMDEIGMMLKHDVDEVAVGF